MRRLRPAPLAGASLPGQVIHGRKGASVESAPVGSSPAVSLWAGHSVEQALQGVRVIVL